MKKYCGVFLTNNIHITRIVVFSSRKSAHVILRHTAATFAKEVKFGFVYNSNKNQSIKLRKLLHVENTDGSILVVVNSVDPLHPEAHHSELDLALYSKDADGLIEAIKQRIEPDLASLSYSNFVDSCFKSYGKLDSSQICFTFLFSNAINEEIKSIVTKIVNEGDVRMVAVDCLEQPEFCENLGYLNKPSLVAISGPDDKFVQYNGALVATQVPQILSWMNGIFDFEDYQFQKHCGFPAERLDAFSKAKRNFSEKLGPVGNIAGEFFGLFWSLFSNTRWLIESFFSVLFTLVLPLIIFGSLFMRMG